MRQFLRVLLMLGLSAVMAFTLVSCGGSGGGGGDAPTRRSGSPITSMDITPKNLSLTFGGTRQFTATATFADGTSGDVTTEVSWSTTDTSVATAGIQGLIRGGATWGTASIIAVDTDTGISSTTGSARLCISGPEHFETDTGPFTLANTALATCGDKDVVDTNCDANDAYPDVLELNTAVTGTASATIDGIDATGFTGIQVHFTASYPTGSGATNEIDEHINVNACCGAGCPLSEVGDATNSNDAGGVAADDDWIERGPVILDTLTFNNCSDMTVSFEQTTTVTDEVAHMDAYALSGNGSLGLTLTNNVSNVFTGSFAACEAVTVPVTCTWSTASGTFTGGTDNVIFN